LGDVTYYTISNQHYFVGTIALLNSLRLTRNSHELVVLDCGLNPKQRALLDLHASVVPVPGHASHPAFAKPFISHLHPAGVVVFVDSDVIVTRSLEQIASSARQGKICLYPTSPSERDRWFPEWHEVLGLRAPLRRQRYMSNGFIALSIDHWPNFLHRWYEVSAKVPRDQYMTRANGRHPFWVGEMDALNALLMSEIPGEAVLELPEEEAVLTGDLHRVRILDPRTLRCRHRDRLTTCLHYAGRKKPWAPGSWRWIQGDAYVRLLPRVLFADDVAAKLPPEDVAPWLRDGTGARLLRSALLAAQSPRTPIRRATRAVVHRLPRRLRERILVIGGRVAHGRQ
jgi:hypothetical protein